MQLKYLLKKTNSSFDFFLHNRKQRASIYLSLLDIRFNFFYFLELGKLFSYVNLTCFFKDIIFRLKRVFLYYKNIKKFITFRLISCKCVCNFKYLLVSLLLNFFSLSFVYEDKLVEGYSSSNFIFGKKKNKFEKMKKSFSYLDLYNMGLVDFFLVNINRKKFNKSGLFFRGLSLNSKKRGNSMLSLGKKVFRLFISPSFFIDLNIKFFNFLFFKFLNKKYGKVLFYYNRFFKQAVYSKKFLEGFISDFSKNDLNYDFGISKGSRQLFYNKWFRFRNIHFFKLRDLNYKRKYFRFFKLCSILMKSGLKARAVSILTKSLILLKERVGVECSYNLVDFCLSLLEPMFCLRKIRKSGRNIFVPRPCRIGRKVFLGIKFFVEGIVFRCKKTRMSLSVCIFLEIKDLLFGRPCDSMRIRNNYLKRVFEFKGSSFMLKKF